MTNLDYYLTYDHDARSKTTMLSVAAGIVAAAVAMLFDDSFKTAGIVCTVVVGVTEIMRAWRYVQPSEKKRLAMDVPLLSRRSIVFLPVWAFLFLVFAICPTPRIEAAVIEGRLKRDASDPSDSENIKETKMILAEARAENIKISPAVLESAGQQYIRATNANPAAWDAVLAIGDYRSFLNVDAQPKLPLPYAIEIQMLNRHATYPTVTASGKVPADQTAIYNQIGKSPVEGERFGPAFFIAEGDEEILDGMHLKNVVFRHVNILYSGGQTVLENVYFVDCLFGFQPPPNQNVLGLMEQILKSPSVTFTAQ